MKQKFPHPSKKNEHFEFLDGKFCNISNSSEKIKVITTAEIFANTIDAVMKKKSITKNFLI